MMVEYATSITPAAPSCTATGGRTGVARRRRGKKLAGRPAVGRSEHVPDAEIHWPSLDGSPHTGQVWAIEVELTPKTLARTSRIMTGLLTPPRYARVLYLTASAAGPVVTRAAAALPRHEQARLTVENLPGSALSGPV